MSFWSQLASSQSSHDSLPSQEGSSPDDGRIHCETVPLAVGSESVPELSHGIGDNSHSSAEQEDERETLTSGTITVSAHTSPPTKKPEDPDIPIRSSLPSTSLSMQRPPKPTTQAVVLGSKEPSPVNSFDLEEEEEKSSPPLSFSTPKPSKPTNATTVPSSLSRIMDTPHRTVRPSPKLVFVNETVPLEKLQETTLKRRRDMVARMHDLDCQLARLLSLYADETMDFTMAIGDTMDRSVGHPLEAAVERLVMEREASSMRGPAVTELEQRLAEMDLAMTNFQHVTLSDAKREDLDSLHSDLVQQIIPTMHLEHVKSDKIEGGVVRRYDNVAGTICRQFHQEAAARRANLELVQRRFEHSGQQQSQRGDDLLKTIQELRQSIQRERLQRQAQDKLIRDEIIRTTVAMKRALLLAVGSGHE